MTVPILTIVHTNQNRSELLPGVTIAYYIPTHFQHQVPQPFDADIVIDESPARIIYTRQVFCWILQSKVYMTSMQVSI